MTVTLTPGASCTRKGPNDCPRPLSTEDAPAIVAPASPSFLYNPVVRIIEFFRVIGKDRLSKDAETITPATSAGGASPIWWPSPLRLTRPSDSGANFARLTPGAPLLSGRRGCSIVTGAWSGGDGLTRTGLVDWRCQKSRSSLPVDEGEPSLH